MYIFKRFYNDQTGMVAITLTILFPLIIVLLALSFDGANMFLKQARLSDALREASLGANFLESENEKRNYIKNYLKAYFKKDVDFSNITLTEETLSNPARNTATSKNKSESIKVVTAKADISFPVWFAKIFGNRELKVQSEASIEPANKIDSNADYLFAMDFSGSMSGGFFTSTKQIGFCKPTSPDYDEAICSKLAIAKNRAEVMQAIVAKIITIINSKPNSSTFGFLPFYAGSQIKKDFVYSVKTSLDPGAKPTEVNTQANYYVLQISFKDEYELSDYDFWSGTLTGEMAQAGGNRLHKRFDQEPYLSHPELGNARRFFDTFTRPRTWIINDNIELRISQVIDYEKTLKNMFNPEKIFTFRFFSTIDTNSEIAEARRNGVAYDFYGDKTATGSKSSRQLDIRFFEEPFRPVSNPLTLDVLNLKPFGPGYGGGTLTLVSTALLRGAALLTKGKNRKRTLFVITDGVDDELYGTGNPLATARLSGMEDRLFDMGLCNRFRSGMKAFGGEAQIFFINISKKTESKNTLKKWQACAGKENAAIVENIDEFLSVFKKFLFGSQSGIFTHK